MAAAAMKYQGDVCPDLETIAAFLDARLTASERETVSAHLASCEKCYFVFSEAAHLRSAGTDRSVDKWWRRRNVMWSSAAALATAAAVVLAVRVGPWASDAPKFEALVTAVGAERLIEPRLTGGFAYGPIRGPVRSGPAPAMLLSPDLRIAVATIEKETEARFSVNAFHARGVAALLVGEVERAITTLEVAAKQRADNADLLNDLAAAYLVRAERTSSKDDFSKALATTNRALEIDAELVEAHFNRAYALGRLGLNTEAREAWQRYLVIDAESPWAGEARIRLEQLARQP